jgi:hypothetical protein
MPGHEDFAPATHPVRRATSREVVLGPFLSKVDFNGVGRYPKIAYHSSSIKHSPIDLHQPRHMGRPAKRSRVR